MASGSAQDTEGSSVNNMSWEYWVRPFQVPKTLRRLRQRFFWGQHRRDVEDFCHRCDACAAYKGPLEQQAVGAMERVAMNIMGPFPVSERGNWFVLTAMDYFTKWPEA